MSEIQQPHMYICIHKMHLDLIDVSITDQNDCRMLEDERLRCSVVSIIVKQNIASLSILYRSPIVQYNKYGDENPERRSLHWIMAHILQQYSGIVLNNNQTWWLWCWAWGSKVENQAVPSVPRYSSQINSQWINITSAPSLSCSTAKRQSYSGILGAMLKNQDNVRERTHMLRNIFSCISREIIDHSDYDFKFFTIDPRRRTILLQPFSQQFLQEKGWHPLSSLALVRRGWQLQESEDGQYHGL